MAHDMNYLGFMNYLEKTGSLAAGQTLFSFWFWMHVVYHTTV